MKRTVVFIVVLCLCLMSNALAAADGWADENGGTTGGAGGTEVTVYDADDFIYYVQSTHQDPYIIYVNGNIDLGSSNIRVRGNKTIIGLPGSHITGNLKCYRSEESNNIFRYLDMDNQDEAGDGDCISLDGVSHIWIDHCTFTDAGDGAVDIKNGADYITISWCKFQYTFDSGHNYTNLVGHDDDNGDTDIGHLRVTFHHNWYSTMCKERMPRVRFGQVHVYNNYYSDELLDGGYCIGVGVEAHIRVENNYFDTVWNPWKDYYTGNGADGEIGWNDGNVFYECSIPTWATNNYATIFTPPYSYTLDDAALIPGIVQWGAGTDGKDGYPPHWYHTMYGDFDISGLVDVNDLETFTGYWLDTTDIDDADYDDSGRVDLTEFNLFAGNYLYTPPDTTAPTAPDSLSALAGDNTVGLDWADNNESDLDGYNVYRSITAGSGYTKLNVLPLADSEYTDDTVTNNTVYFYVVTAIDTSSNESGNSNQVSAVPIDTNTIILQENEAGFCDIDGIIDTAEHPGYTGYGYCDTENITGSGINWSINVITAGTYTFTWRFANGSDYDRPARLLINSIEEIASINFPVTGAWENWTEVSVTITLTAGMKDVRLEATNSNGCANIDYLRITGPAVEAAACP